jgi:hypothetical protein
MLYAGMYCCMQYTASNIHVIQGQARTPAYAHVQERNLIWLHYTFQRDIMSKNSEHGTNCWPICLILLIDKLTQRP